MELVLGSLELGGSALLTRLGPIHFEIGIRAAPWPARCRVFPACKEAQEASTSIRLRPVSPANDFLSVLMSYLLSTYSRCRFASHGIKLLVLMVEPGGIEPPTS
jgi:hypothetical protein